MSKHLHTIEDLFRNSLGDHRDSPSDNAWENIEAKLDKEDAVNYKRKFSGLKRTAAVLLLLLSGIAIYEALFIHESNRMTIKRNNDMKNTATNEHNSIQYPANNPVSHTTQQPSAALNELAEDDLLKTNNSTSDANSASPVAVTNRSQTIKPGRASISKTASANDISFDYTNAATSMISENEHRHNAIAFAAFPERKTISILSTPLTTNFSVPTLVINPKGRSAKKNRLPFFKPYWTFTAAVSDDQSRYILDNDVDDDDNNTVVQEDQKTVIANRERHEPSFSAGVLGTYRFKKKWALQTGILYSYTQIGIDPQKMYAKQDDGGDVSYKYNSSSGYAYITPGFGLPPSIGDSLNATEAKHNLGYLTIPIILQYKWSLNKITVSPGAGIALNTLLSARLATEVKDAMNRETVTINRLEGLRRMYAGLIINTDLQYDLGRNWSVNLTPSFKYALTPINKNNVVKTYPYSFGLGTGISYRF